MLLAVALAACAALAGCGVGPGEELGGGAELRITRDFGRVLLASAERERVHESDTVLRLLEEERQVETAYGGGFVQAIDGLEGGGPSGGSDWFYFVNGLEAAIGSADRRLYPGDVVQWDHRYWQAAMRVPAIVGAYPEPFVHGSEGDRFPVRLECGDDQSAACEEVRRRLTEAGVTVSGGALGAPAGPGILRVAVGAWPAVRELQAAQAIERGPQASGVFARLPADGSEIVVLDERGEEAASLGSGSGLVAAVQAAEQGPTWVVTGTDEAGVEAAARALDESVLRDAFAVAVGPDGPLRLPMLEGGGS